MCNSSSSCGTGWSTGSDSNSGNSKSLPKLTLAGAFTVMSGGDTLIIGSGTYTGNSNAMTPFGSGAVPPNGSSSAYTTIRAEHDGGVLFDGQSINNMFYVVSDTVIPRYWQFEGLIWATGPDGPVNLIRASYVKFLRCGAYDTPNGNYANFNISRSSYILCESCYAWGSGRYKFIAYLSDHVIFRWCVGRPDGINAGGDPAAGFSVYSSTYVKVQNSIVIDADQTASWVNIGDRVGSFAVPCTNEVSQYIDFDKVIGLNVKLGGITTSKNTDSANVMFTDMVIWDSTDDSAVLNSIRGSSNSVRNSTFGYSGTTTTYPFYWDGASGSMTNTILYRLLFSGSMFGASPTTQNYNLYYANTNNSGRTGANDLTTVDPTTNSLRYLPRIEPGSSLKGAGSGGADIGANLDYLIGMAGTLWGEAGYATVTSTPMWPFPHEDLFKTKMAAYSSGGVSGARGFCAGASKDGSTQTLTKYIWEYLGNQIPSDIYGGLRAPLVLRIIIPQ
jgi:hypothetical protein